jgi:CRISPR-associated protein Cas2
MLVLVTYDVSTLDKAGPKRLRRVAKVCRDYGQRVQYSVFELDVDTVRWTFIRKKLCDLIDPELDSLRFYYLGLNWKGRVEHVGAKPTLNLDAPLVF